MEIGTIILALFAGVIMCAAVYYYADSRSKSFWIARLQDQLEVQRKEMREWQNKALVKHGTVPLDKHPTKMSKAKKQEITPKVVTRQQLEYRETDPMTTPVTIHAHDVSYQRVGRTVEKVAEIIAAHK